MFNLDLKNGHPPVIKAFEKSVFDRKDKNKHHVCKNFLIIQFRYYFLENKRFGLILAVPEHFQQESQDKNDAKNRILIKVSCLTSVLNTFMFDVNMM